MQCYVTLCVVKQKTAYERRISDWSSDVCSSDLADRYDPCMARLIEHLDLVARGDLARLRRLCAVDDEDLADMIRELRGYDPKQGLRFGGEAMQAVVPDLSIARRPPGWAIEIHAATLPRVLVTRRHHAEWA